MDTSLSNDPDQMQYDLFMFQYMTCWYYSSLAFALADIQGRTQSQLIFLLIVYIFNIISYSSILGVLIDTLYDL